MFGNVSMMDRLKSLDVYRKMPKNYLQPTFMGAVGKNKTNITLKLSFCNSNRLHGTSISQRIVFLRKNKNCLRHACGHKL
jgi:hypothetical protein